MYLGALKCGQYWVVGLLCPKKVKCACIHVPTAGSNMQGCAGCFGRNAYAVSDSEKGTLGLR